ncbi:hypothetical protein ACJMK2_034883 [Sinanodonta woodiana]|uniref:Fanconi anemia core complex-associated protein 24 n=1 Tax=Sinanodonta woodiana TaxID=1069815 RepID=A0ABD3WT17_SINWO
MAGCSDDFQLTQTPVKSTLRVPVGHIILSGRWRNTDLSSGLQGCVNILYEDSLGLVDFHPASHIGVLYASEADLVFQGTLRRKLAKLRKVNKVQVIVLAEKTPSSTQYFQSLQKFVTLELGFVLLAVPGQQDAAGLLAQIVHTENHQDVNPFCKKRKASNLDQCLLTTVQSIPKLGEVKAKQLLEKFKSIQAICDASLEELSAVVGHATAAHIRSFFDSPLKS